MKEMERKQTLLIVDDAPMNIKVLCDALKSDYRIRIVTNGQQCIEIAMSSNPPDLILLDIVMPEMDGYEVCRRLKKEKITQNIPVIFITGMDDEEDETKGLELGAVDYITKPFSQPIVKARVKTHLELKRHRDILENLSTLDGLTGIPNRRRFDKFIEREWLKCMREPNPLSLIMIDIDFFKVYNDTYGHGEGDECLKKVAKTLASSVKRVIDFVARYGGEEFVCVLPETGIRGAASVAKRMRSAIESLNITHKNCIVKKYVTISLGVASIIPSKKYSISDLIKAADTSLYKVKEEGRNHIKCVDLDLKYDFKIS